MPHHIKILLSLAWLATAAAGYVFMVYLGQRGPSYAVVFLGVFATAAMWIFPEVVKKDLSQARK
jgi:hypothetical protein